MAEADKAKNEGRVMTWRPMGWTEEQERWLAETLAKAPPWTEAKLAELRAIFAAARTEAKLRDETDTQRTRAETLPLGPDPRSE